MEDFYQLHNIDVSKLTRDYISEPLVIGVNGKLEYPSKSDLIYLYIELNLKRETLCKLFNTSPTTIKKWNKEYNIKKSTQQVHQNGVKTVYERFGVKSTFEIDSVKHKIKKTNIERYGVSTPFQNKDIQSKVRKTMKTKYDVVQYVQTEEYMNAHYGNDVAKILLSKNKLRDYMVDNNITSGGELSQKLGICQATASKYIRKYSLQSLLKYGYSLGEKEVRDFVNQYYETINNSKSIIYPYEIDMFIPQLNVAIEYNGNYWHNLQKQIIRDEEKRKRCVEKKISLITIMEDDWKANKDKIKNILIDKLNNIKKSLEKNYNKE